MPTDYSHVTDDELDKLVAAKMGGAQPDYSKMSDDELNNAVHKKSSGYGFEDFVKSAGNKLGNDAMSALQAPEKYVEKPFRAGVSALQNDVTDLSGAGKAALSQFSPNPAPAPSYSDIYQKAGLSPDKASLAGDFTEMFSPATYAAGFGLGKAAKAAGAGIEAGKGLIKPATDAAKSGLIKGAAYLGGEVTGVPSEAIETYMKRGKDVDQLIKQYGTDTASASDDVRQGFQNAIQNTRKELNSKISSALKSSSPDKAISSKPILDKIEEIKSQVNKTLYPDQYKTISDFKQRISDVAGEGGTLNKQELFDVQKFLKDNSNWQFGSIFPKGSNVERAAKAGEGVARGLLNEQLPDVRQANSSLASLHRVQDKINKNVLTPGNPEASLLAAGNGSNPRQQKMLQLLEKQTGYPFLEKAENLAAQRQFAKPGLFPIDSTGKSLTRLGAAGLAGGAVGGIPGAITGAALSSPRALKTAIQVGRIPVRIVNALVGGTGSLTEGAINKAAKILGTPEGRSAFTVLMGTENGLLNPGSPKQGLLKNE